MGLPDDDDGLSLIEKWLRNKNTIEFLSIWEMLNNLDFKPVEFDGFKKQAGRSQNATLEISRGRHQKYLPTIDNKDVFHFRASLKDLGKKWFAFSKLEKDAFDLMERLKRK